MTSSSSEEEPNVNDEVILLRPGGSSMWQRDSKISLFNTLLDLGFRIPYTIAFRSKSERKREPLSPRSILPILKIIETTEGIKLCSVPIKVFTPWFPRNGPEPLPVVEETYVIVLDSVNDSVPGWKLPDALEVRPQGADCTDLTHEPNCLTQLANVITGRVEGIYSSTSGETIVQICLVHEVVAFASVCTRNPKHFQPSPIGYFWINSRGPQFVSEAVLGNEFYAILSAACQVLERHFGCVCRIDVTWDGREMTILDLHLVRSDEAITVDLLELANSFSHCDVHAFIANSHNRILNTEQLVMYARGNSLGRSRVTGRAVFDAARASQFPGEAIVIQEEGTLDLVPYFPSLKGLINKKGAVTSHLSVLARSMGLCSLTGIPELGFDETSCRAVSGQITVHEGDWLTIDELAGTLYLGRGEIAEDETESLARTRALTSANVRRCYRILVNADTCARVEEGLRKGADGIGLCRSEHHLVDRTGLTEFRAIFLAGADISSICRTHVLARLQTKLVELLRTANGRPFHYRLIDTRLDELFALNEEGTRMLAEYLGWSRESISSRITSLLERREVSHFRGCRWALIDPLFYGQQMEAAINAVRDVRRDGIHVDLKIIIPLVTTASEIVYLRSILDGLRGRLSQELNTVVQLGAMIETPRAALCAYDIAQLCSVLCFGTNDLTESTWNIRRDTDSVLIESFRSYGHIVESPFAVLDQEGVGRLLHFAINEARIGNPNVQCYLCGEQANDADSVATALGMGMNGVSCSPDSVQAAIIMAAQVSDRYRKKGVGYVPFISEVGRDTESVQRRITAHLMLGHRGDAQNIAYSWARATSQRLGLPTSDVWKFFKRDLVNLFFGKKAGRRFGPGWSTDEVLSYALSLKNEGHPRVRYSAFPRTIAAQSRTRQLTPSATSSEWRGEIDAEDHGVALEVFPQPEKVRLAFRAVYRPSLLDYEAGWGEAADLFWKHPGIQPMVMGRYIDSQTYELRFVQGEVNTTGSASLLRTVGEFLEIHGSELLARCDALCDALGLEWVSIEGYAPNDNYMLSVVDIDLALDLAFY